MGRKRRHQYRDIKVDSKWEESLVQGLFKDFEYHPEKIHYTKPETKHTYQPDWKINKFKKIIYIEAKGRFRSKEEYTKYLHVREALEENEELVFLFMKPKNAMPGAKKRKDGTVRTHAEWAESNGFRWYDENSIKEFI